MLGTTGLTKATKMTLGTVPLGFMTIEPRQEGHVTGQNGNDGAALVPGVPTFPTVIRSHVPGGTDTTTDGNVTADGHGNPGHVSGNGNVSGEVGTVPVPGERDRFPRRLGAFRRNRSGHGNVPEERAHVPVSVPVSHPVATAETDDPTQAADRDDAADASKWPMIILWAAIVAMTAMTTVLASSGQIDGTWTWAGLDATDPRRYLLPGSTEFAVVGFLLIGQYALHKKHSPFLWWWIAAGFAVLAVLMNSVHGDPGYKLRQGLIFGGASAASLLMWFAKFWIDYLSYRRKQGHITGLRPQAWTVRAVFSFPGLALRADLIIARCDKVLTREQAYELAELWRWAYQDARDGKNARKLCSRAAWRIVYRELGMKVIELSNQQLPKITFELPDPPAPTVPPASPAPVVRRLPVAPVAPAPDAAPAAGKAPEPKITNEKPVPEHFWTDHRQHIADFQAAVGDWMTREKVTVNDVQAVVPNRTNAAETAACIRALRAGAGPAQD